MKNRTILCLVILALTGLPIHAQVNVVPPGSIVEGLTLEEWSAEWWKWVFAIPASVSPWFSSEEASAQQGQSGPVFFVTAGVSAGGNYQYSTRPVTVPSDKYVFVPIINTEHDNVGRDVALSAAELRAEMFDWAANVNEVWAAIDGATYTNLHQPEQFLNSPAFTYTLPVGDSIFERLNVPLTNVADDGSVSPVVSGGYMLMLAPMPPGQHIVHTKGGLGPPHDLGFESVYLFNVTDASATDPGDPLKDLIERVRMANSDAHALVASLEAAQASFDRGDAQAGINQVNAFQNKVRAMMGKQNPGLAEEWIEAAREIMRQAEAGR